MISVTTSFIIAFLSGILSGVIRQYYGYTLLSKEGILIFVICMTPIILLHAMGYVQS